MAVRVPASVTRLAPDAPNVMRAPFRVNAVKEAGLPSAPAPCETKRV